MTIPRGASLRRWVAVALVAITTFLWARPSSGLPVGTAAPSTTLAMADGTRFVLDDARGRPVVLAFWATWCPACRAEAPDLARVERELASRGDTLVALSVDALPLAEVAAEADRLGMPRRVALADAALTTRYGVTLLPTTVVIAPDGTIARVFSGGASADEILAATEQARERGGRP